MYIKNKISLEEYRKKKKPAKRNKYGAKKCEYQGIKFDSQVERDYYIELVSIHGKNKVEIQPKFLLQEGYTNNKGQKIKPIHYIADFKIGKEVFDVKGHVTDVFQIKKKIFEKLYPELKFYIVKSNKKGWELI